jgi:hypothetical protein
VSSKEDGFDYWYARAHPHDWYTKELGAPLPGSVRLHIWALCRAAWMREDLPQRQSSNGTEGLK